MKKIILSIIFSLIILPLFTACNDSYSEIEGLWFPLEHFRPGLEDVAKYGWSDDDGYCGGWLFCPRFVNKNTVQICDISIYDSYQSNDVVYTEKILGKNFYFKEMGSTTYTYYMDGNKIYTTEGTILTFSNGKLYKDGDSNVYNRIDK